jgi:hypothetical protein
MSQFTIIAADERCGRGARGLNLQRFLRIYHGRRAVRMMSTADLLQGPPLETEILFIGLPTRLCRQHLARVRYRQAVLFDYHDCPGPAWIDSDQELLRSLTDHYLKPWVEDEWDYGLRMGVLPIRRHFKLKACVGWQSMCRRLGRRPPDRIHDVVFVGEATAGPQDPHQRIEWIREIRRASRPYAFWGGIAARPAVRPVLEQQFVDFPQLCYQPGRVDFLTYYSQLRRARVALAPAGNAPWSYRHYEAIYAGALLVSTDFRHVRTLIPLPQDRMIHVPHGESVLPAIDQALNLSAQSTDWPARNVAYLEQFLHYGDYCRTKPLLRERFFDQLSN